MTGFPAPIRLNKPLIILAAVIFAAGMGVYLAMTFASMARMMGRMDRYKPEPMTVPGGKTVTFTEPGEYIIIFFSNQKNNFSFSSAGVKVQVSSKDTGGSVPIMAGPVYTFFGGGSLSFSISRPGDYLLSAQYPPGQSGPVTDLVVMDGSMYKMQRAMLIPQAIAAGSFILAALIVALTIIRYRRQKKAAWVPPLAPLSNPPPLLPQVPGPGLDF